MKKRFLTLLLTLLAVLTLTVPAWAEQTPDDLLIYDTESLLTEEEWWELEMTANRISWQYNCAVYIVTIYDYEEYGGSVYEAAANIYNAQDFGIGQNRDGILLLMSMWDRSYALYVRNGGFAEKAVGKYAQTLLEDSFLDQFGENDWQGGFASYLATCEDFMARAEAGSGQKAPDESAASGAGHRLRRGAGGMHGAETEDEVRPSGSGGGYLCHRGRSQPDGAL